MKEFDTTRFVFFGCCVFRIHWPFAFCLDQEILWNQKKVKESEIPQKMSSNPFSNMNIFF